METRRPSRSRRRPKARSTDVLGNPSATPRINPRWRKYYDRLRELREMLVSSQGQLTRDALEEQPTYSTHMADAGTDNYDRDLALGMLSSEQDAVYEIDQALERILNGSYGICELTGKKIEPERLEAIPWTRFSAAAEAQVERSGALKTAKLGPRQTVKAAPGDHSEEPD